MINTFNMNPLQYGMAEQHMFSAQEMNEYGYETISTFWQDFSQAECFGLDAIRDTYRRTQEWLSDYKMYTELILVLNHKCWEHYSRKQEDESRLYGDLFYDACGIFQNKWRGNAQAMDYYFRITD